MRKKSKKYLNREEKLIIEQYKNNEWVSVKKKVKKKYFEAAKSSLRKKS